jgi:hypothetical protein
MTLSNIATFELQLLRAVAALYAQHPKPVNMGSLRILAPHIEAGDPDYNIRVEEAAGTLRWLHRNGIVIGDLHAGEDIASIGDAQLSLAAYVKLRATEGGGGKTLGRIAIETLASGTEQEIAAIAALVVQRLCGRESAFRRVNASPTSW